METSRIKIRPFIPWLKNEQTDSREPFAVLRYGNIEVELDYTIMDFLTLDVESDLYSKTASIAHAAFKEIIKEMCFDLYNELPSTHRDGGHRFLKSITDNPLHLSNNEIQYI